MQTNHIRDHNDRYKDNGGLRGDINYAMFMLSQGVGQQGFPEESESEVAQSCLTLYDPMNCSLPGSSIHGIFQARISEWVTISFSRDLPNPGIEPRSPAWRADSLSAEP